MRSNSSATLSCSLATRLVDGKPHSQPTPNGLIAYAGSDGNIYTIDRLGENQKSFTNDANLDFQTRNRAHLSIPHLGAGRRPPRLRRAERFAASPSSSRLLTASVGSGETVEAFSSDVYQPFYLYWSPDSRNISFLSNGTGEGGLVLHLAAADGSGATSPGRASPTTNPTGQEQGESVSPSCQEHRP